MKNNLGTSCSTLSCSKVSAKNMSCSFYLIDTKQPVLNHLLLIIENFIASCIAMNHMKNVWTLVYKIFCSNVILYKLLHLSCAYHFRFCTLLLPGLFVHSTVRINVNCFLLEWFYQCWTYSKWTKLLQSQKEHHIKDICKGVPIITMMFLWFSRIYGWSLIFI